MFWKKKTKSNIHLDPQFSDHRDAFRIAPESSKPVIITITGDSYHALNVSGTGICFRSPKFSAGTIIAATVRVPSEDRIFPVTLEVVSKQGNMCRCRFQKIHREAEDLLHAYILELQKAKIRKNQSH